MSSGMIFMWTLIIGGIIVLVGAAVILLNLKKDEDVEIVLFLKSLALLKISRGKCQFWMEPLKSPTMEST